VTAFELAQRFVGVKEAPEHAVNPLVLAMLRLDAPWPDDDAVPWCSAFCNFVAWLLRLPRSKSLLARSWLKVGTPIELTKAYPADDVVIFSRGAGGHVGFFAGVEGDQILVLGGNQQDEVCIEPFPRERLLGVRRLG
jgi:uncharacterized protein (TIGR02594 family)